MALSKGPRMSQIPDRIIKFGTNPIYLPKFTITLLRTPRLSPYHAKFKVPLYFTKLDLRDYLFHVYNVRALSIRSQVIQHAVRDHMDAPRQFFRPESEKTMTVEMTQPFVWPKEPESWEPWGRAENQAREKSGVQEGVGKDTAAQRAEARALRSQVGEVIRPRREDGGQRVATEAIARKRWEKKRTLKQLEVEEKPEFKIRV